MSKDSLLRVSLILDRSQTEKESLAMDPAEGIGTDLPRGTTSLSSGKSLEGEWGARIFT